MVLRFAVLLALVPAVLVAPAAAQAADPDGFAATFPRAAALCKKADAGRLGAKLKPDAAKVKRACTRLRSTYTQALATYQAAAQPLIQQMKAAIQQSRDACRAARANRDNAACRAAQQEASRRTRELRQQVGVHARARQAKNEAARKAFWAAIRKLRGGKGVKADPVLGSAPTTDVPDDSGIESA